MKQNQLIDIIAPSSPPQNNKWKKGVKILQSWGFQIRFSSSALCPYLFHSNSNQKRSFFLNQAFSSRDSSIVWMLRGGYGFQKLLPDFIKQYSKKNKKLFIGYSDGTALHSYLNHQDQKTLHAPAISELADLSQKELDLLKKIILGWQKEVVFTKLKVFKPSSLNKTLLKGKIIGGNLSLLSSSIGTAWLSVFKPGFLFLEDVNESAYKADRMLHHLFYSGSLKFIQAVLFGNFSPIPPKDFQKILKSFSQVCSIPLIYKLPCGHKKNQPLPLNSPAHLTFQNGEVQLKAQSVFSSVPV